MAEWRAEEYSVTLHQAWMRAKAIIERVQYARGSRDVPGNTSRGLCVGHQFSGETFKHILLPLWIAKYRYKDKLYFLLVNGQTGEVTGDAPRSKIKIILFVMAIALIFSLPFLLLRVY